MSQPLPYRDFKWKDPEEILSDNYHENSNKGIILEETYNTLKSYMTFIMITLLLLKRCS